MNTTTFQCRVISAHTLRPNVFTFIHNEYKFTGTRFGAIREGILQARRYGATEIRRVEIISQH